MIAWTFEETAKAPIACWLLSTIQCNLETVCVDETHVQSPQEVFNFSRVSLWDRHIPLLHSLQNFRATGLKKILKWGNQIVQAHLNITALWFSLELRFIFGGGWDMSCRTRSLRRGLFLFFQKQSATSPLQLSCILGMLLCRSAIETSIRDPSAFQFAKNYWRYFLQEHSGHLSLSTQDDSSPKIKRIETS